MSAIAMAMIFQVKLKVKKRFSRIWWQEVLSKRISNTYEKIVHWKDLFILPSGVAGKRYVEEVTHIVALWIQDTPFKSISLKAIHAMPLFLLQKPSKSSKVKDHLQALERRIKMLDEGDIVGLLYEGMTVQQRLRSDKEGVAIAKISLKFKNLMCKGNVNGPLKLLTDNMHSGILPLNKETLKLLIQKHPEPREPSPDILIQGPTRPIHPVAYDGMDESVIMKASMLIKDGSGPSGLDADGWFSCFWNSNIRFTQNICSVN